ncbi:MAG: hypothetical protein M5U34_07580 [Chloroflexi bacterium]|nr:hypothetical protein [Chloroflexota bacterium]
MISGIGECPRRQGAFADAPTPQQTRQLVRPLMRATPEFGETSWDRWPAHRETAVNCPRCGTDNRNWLRLAYARPADNRRTWVYEHLSKFLSALGQRNIHRPATALFIVQYLEQK